MAFPLSKVDYERVGKNKGLTFVDDLAPNTVYDKCNWTCDTCGKAYFKTYRAVYLGEHGCRCQNSMSMPVEKYYELGKKLGIELVKKANNYKEPSEWRSVSGNGGIVMASYYQLAYAPHRNAKLLAQLNIKATSKNDEPVTLNTLRHVKATFLLTPDSTDAQKGRALKHARKVSDEMKQAQQYFRLPNQEDEEEFPEVYD